MRCLFHEVPEITDLNIANLPLASPDDEKGETT